MSLSKLILLTTFISLIFIGCKKNILDYGNLPKEILFSCADYSKVTDPNFDSDNLYFLGTRVEKSFIRVESDEVTYPLHIILRFNLERKIFNNEINVNDIPDAWNEEYKRLFDKNVYKMFIGMQAYLVIFLHIH